MNGISLINGIVIATSVGQIKVQDYIEIKLESGRVVIVTASTNGRLKIGLKVD